MKLGFIGLGVMGRPMAGHLLAAGHSVLLHRVKPASEALLAQGGIAAMSATEVARDADIIVLMLPDTPDVEAVLFGQAGVAESLSPGKLVIDMSSISPVETRRLADRIAALGCDYVDAPVSGGEAGAKAASLTIMCGGSEEAFARALPILQLMGKSITRIGACGDGQAAKVANQIVVGLTIAAVSEALTFAERAGADPRRVREALLGGFAASRILEVHGERMLNKTFDPGFRIRLHRKDLSLAIEGARALDLALPGTAIAQQLMNAAVARGDGELDHSALIRTLAGISGA